MRAWNRTGVLLTILSLLIAGCGDGDVNRSEQAVPAGFFIGTTAEGGDLSIAVGSIRAVFFVCGTTVVSARLTPPEPVAVDGSFAVDFQANGQSFLVTGRIEDDTIRGTITGNLECAGDFVARRCNSRRQACGDRDGDLIPDEVDPDSGGTASPTPTTSGPTATVAATSTPLPASATPTGPSPTPSPSTSATFTPGPTVSPTPNGTCGNGQLESDEDCDFKGPIFDTDLCDGSCSCIDFCDTPGGTLTCAGDCTISFDECAAGPDNCF